MKNYVAPGDTVDLTAPANLVSGQAVLIGTIFGCAKQAIASGQVGPIQIKGIVTLPKDTALVISEGDRVFWDAANSWVDKTSAAQVCVGRAVQTTLAATPTIQVLLGPATPAGT